MWDIGKCSMKQFTIVVSLIDSFCRVYNPAFTIRAIHSDPIIRNHSLFLNADVALGTYSDVYFSDSGIFGI